MLNCFGNFMFAVLFCSVRFSSHFEKKTSEGLFRPPSNARVNQRSLTMIQPASYPQSTHKKTKYDKECLCLGLTSAGAKYHPVNWHTAVSNNKLFQIAYCPVICWQIWKSRWLPSGLIQACNGPYHSNGCWPSLTSRSCPWRCYWRQVASGGLFLILNVFN